MRETYPCVHRKGPSEARLYSKPRHRRHSRVVMVEGIVLSRRCWESREELERGSGGCIYIAYFLKCRKNEHYLKECGVVLNW